MNILTRSAGEPDFIAGDHGIRSRCRPRAKPTGEEGGSRAPGDPRPFMGHHEVIDGAVPRNVVIQGKKVLDLEQIAHKIVVGAEEILRNIKEAKPTRIRPTERIVKSVAIAVVALAEAWSLDKGIGCGEPPQGRVIHPPIHVNQPAITHTDMFMAGEAASALAERAAGGAAVRVTYLAEGIETVAGDDIAGRIHIGHRGAEIIFQLESNGLRAVVALAAVEDGRAAGGVYKIAVDFIAGLIEVLMPLEERDVAGIDEDDRAVDVALADAVVVGVVDEVRCGV